MGSIEEHLQDGGSKGDFSTSWSPSSDRYLTYSELELIAESVYVQMAALEDLLQQSNTP